MKREGTRLWIFIFWILVVALLVGAGIFVPLLIKSLFAIFTFLLLIGLLSL